MDETWIHHYIPEPNRPSAEWREAGESRSKRVKASRWAGEELYTCRHSNSFYKLQRIVAYMLRFCYKGYRATTTTVCTKELDRSRNLILRTIQQAEFPADLKMLQRYNTMD
ncbi:hypothetical protein ACLKA7_005052 [Drosophila subpalustris]